MTPPQTNYEVAADWTTLDQEIAFLDQVVAETDLTVAHAGQSVGNRPIRYFTLGAGVDKTLFLSSLIHGNEPASREALLALIRDLAYSTDPAVAEYLASHRLVFYPNGNPDSTLIRRQNVLGFDPNRDRFTAVQPETHAILSVINATEPSALIDCHEYFASGEDWWGFQSHMPSTHPAVRALEQDLFQAGIDLMTGLGYSAAQYPMHIVPRACTTGYTSQRHIVSLTSETNALHGDIHVRVSVQRQFLDMLLLWFGDHADECAAARSQSLQWATTSLDADQLLIREPYVGTDVAEIVHINGYQLMEPLPQRLMDLHGIEVDEGGFVSIFQDARMVIPQILDPAAIDRQVEAVRVPRAAPSPVPPREPLPRRELLGYRVHAGGRTRDVLGVKIKINGRTRDVIMPGQ